MYIGLVSKSIKHTIIDFKPNTPSTCTLRMWGKFIIVNGHVPKEISDYEETDGFFDALE
jgi:hypothetical protein